MSNKSKATTPVIDSPIAMLNDWVQIEKQKGSLKNEAKTYISQFLKYNHEERDLLMRHFLNQSIDFLWRKK